MTTKNEVFNEAIEKILKNIEDIKELILEIDELGTERRTSQQLLTDYTDELTLRIEQENEVLKDSGVLK